ncbi:MAG: aspartyl protease family protein [Anaerolineae bacterium]|nr:aspartyl protease family protein [Anaerolineae bacterium]MCI0610488.1 aspartyl protease family protein [Anaerolineae bacterium]
MPEYDAENFEPPAPVAYVTLRNPATGVLLSDVPMLIDTGADATLLPSDAVEQLGISAKEGSDFEVQAFDGEIKRLKLAKLELYVLGKKFAGEYLLVDRPVGILGRNILNNIRILLDGPRGRWNEQK